MWKFQHPEGQREINMLHVPVGRPVKLVMTSEDVIHSLFIPDFRIHMDLLPERYTSVWFEPTRAGTYHLFCSQYCGTNHAGMVGQVIAMEPEEYAKWLQSRAEGSLGLQGRKTFLKYRCDSCHSADAVARAPVLEGLYGRPVALDDGRIVTADENYLRESILYPSAKIVAGFENIMPSFKGQVSEEEIIELIAFLKALKSGETPQRVESIRRPPARHRSIRMWRPHEHADPQPAAGPRPREAAADVPQRRPHDLLLALDHRPQADRAAVPGARHAHVLHRRCGDLASIA